MESPGTLFVSHVPVHVRVCFDFVYYRVVSGSVARRFVCYRVCFKCYRVTFCYRFAWKRKQLMSHSKTRNIRIHKSK